MDFWTWLWAFSVLVKNADQCLLKAEVIIPVNTRPEADGHSAAGTTHDSNVRIHPESAANNPGKRLADIHLVADQSNMDERDANSQRLRQGRRR
jgi:hypothetical protein